MTEKAKPSDAVRIARIVAPTVLIISLALIFKSEFGNVFNRGCFDLKLEQAGLGLSDKSLCTLEDFEETKDTLLVAGARQAEEAANVYFERYEARLEEAEKVNMALSQRLNRMQDVFKQTQARQDEFKVALERTIRRTTTPETRLLANQLAEQYSAIYGDNIQQIDLQPVQIVDPAVIAEKNATIREDYIQTSRSNVSRVQENLKVERHK